jgi:plasmid stability protein
MPKTVLIRDIDDAVYVALQGRAAAVGTSVPGLLRREVLRLALRSTIEEWLTRTRRRSTELSGMETVEALDEHRGPWPDPGLDSVAVAGS